MRVKGISLRRSEVQSSLCHNASISDRWRQDAINNVDSMIPCITLLFKCAYVNSTYLREEVSWESRVAHVYVAYVRARPLV